MKKGRVHQTMIQLYPGTTSVTAKESTRAKTAMMRQGCPHEDNNTYEVPSSGTNSSKGAKRETF
jgi:hypothetical protein